MAIVITPGPHAAGKGHDPVRAGRAHRHHPANLSILKTGKARAIRFSTLDAICRELQCTPGDLLGHDPAQAQDAD